MSDGNGGRIIRFPGIPVEPPHEPERPAEQEVDADEARHDFEDFMYSEVADFQTRVAHLDGLTGDEFWQEVGHLAEQIAGWTRRPGW